MQDFAITSLGALTGATDVHVTGYDTSTPVLREFRDMALALMAQHGLSNWTFQFDDARRRAGHCRYGSTTLSFSTGLMSIWTPAQQRDTVLHEIAHALNPGDYHGRAWQLTCIRIGADPTTTWGHDGEEELPRKYVGTCPNGHHAYRDRRAQISCARCSQVFDPQFLFTWTANPEY